MILRRKKMSTLSKVLVFSILVFFIISNFVMANEPNSKSKIDAFTMNKMLGRGVNLGNALEAPTEGAWGVVIKEEYFDIIKQAGFNSVRLPVKWSGHALVEKPYTINPDFFKRVDTIVSWAVSRNMPIMVNIQQYNELYTEPLAHKERFMALWKQIAEHYKDYPDTVLFELFNEPDDALTPAMWNEWLKEAITIIRQSNPNRTIVVGSANDSWITYLKVLELPENDRNIIVTVHHYFPHNFTHQGTPWMTPEKVARSQADMKVVNQDPNSDPNSDYNSWPGTKWTGTAEEKKAMTDIFDIGTAWGKARNRPINLGEFGSYYKADMESRARWTKFIADTAAERGMSLMYWEFCAQEFGLYDRDSKSWRKPLLDAIIPPKQ
jgi:endoglucanase